MMARGILGSYKEIRNPGLLLESRLLLPYLEAEDPSSSNARDYI